jgi:phosphohistidine phosphatase
VRVLLVRHAIAQDREVFARRHKNDDARPLTAKGRRRMAAAALGVRTLVPTLDIVASSPLKRALETAEILARVYEGHEVEWCAALAPGGSCEDALVWLRTRADAACVALVGHEPDLSELASFLLLDAVAPLFAFKKGGACLLEFGETIEAGEAMLLWLLQPNHLRALGADRA